MAGFTKGPWVVIESRDVFPAVVAPCRATICIDVENIDDARLIAAAPDLYAELSHLVSLLGPWEETGALPPGLATLNGARLALAKAASAPAQGGGE